MTTRRHFLKICGLAMAGAVGRPAAAGATRARVLDGAGDGDRPIQIGQISPELQRFMGGIRVGTARAHGGLLVFWLAAKDMPPALEVSTLDEARAKGTIVITERDQATVPELLVDNRGKVAVLMLAGEILIGGKQNRVLKEDLLLPPLSGPRNISVYCVERGRWNEGRKDFESKSSFAQPGVRAYLMKKAPQSEVWDAVARAARVAQAPSPTGSYQQVYESPEVKAHLAEMERGLDATPAAGSSGAAVFTAGGLSGLDLFHPGTLRARVAEAPAGARGRSPASARPLVLAGGDTAGAGRAAAGKGREDRGIHARQSRRGPALRVPARPGAGRGFVVRGAADPHGDPLAGR